MPSLPVGWLWSKYSRLKHMESNTLDWSMIVCLACVVLCEDKIVSLAFNALLLCVERFKMQPQNQPQRRNLMRRLKPHHSMPMVP